MADYSIIQKSDLATDSFKNDNTNGKGGIKIAVSPDKGNLLQHRKNGIYYGIEAPADTSNLYVSSSQGNDNNEGTKASPLRTIHEALKRNNVNQKFAINLKEDDEFEWRSSWGNFANYCFTIRPYGPQWDSIVAANSPSTAEFYRSNNGLRPTVKFISDSTFRVNGADWGVVRAATVNTQTTGQYACTFAYCTLDFTTPITPDPHSYINSSWFGSGNTGVYMQLVGCVLKAGDKGWFLSIGAPSQLRVDACKLDTSAGTKVINLTPTGQLAFALLFADQVEGAAIAYSKGLTRMGTSSVAEWKAVINGNQGVTPGNITTNQQALGA